jgi:hypothetical protein
MRRSLRFGQWSPGPTSNNVLGVNTHPVGSLGKDSGVKLVAVQTNRISKGKEVVREEYSLAAE